MPPFCLTSRDEAKSPSKSALTGSTEKLINSYRKLSFCNDVIRTTERRAISALDIDPLLKENFAKSPCYGKLKALTVEVKNREILNSARVLIGYKSKLK